MTRMAHTYWDPKGLVKARPGGYTYYGGRTTLSDLYKQRYLPHYNKDTNMTNESHTNSIEDFKKSCDWNKYQKRNWYQDHLDNARPSVTSFPGTHAEWRNVGEFEKSYRKYNSEIVHGFDVTATSTNAEGNENVNQFHTTDPSLIKECQNFDDNASDNNDIKYFNEDLRIQRPNTSPIKMANDPSTASVTGSPHPRETFRKNQRSIFGQPRSISSNQC